LGIIVIKAGREKPIKQQHPWIFSGAIERTEDAPSAGGIVTVIDQHGAFLARGYYNVRSQIQVRILTWHDEDIDAAWWQRMLARAVTARAPYAALAADAPAANMPLAYRLIHAENDYLPGLTVDRYGDTLVLQAGTLAIDQRKRMLGEMLLELTGAKRVYERSDIEIRGKDGLGIVTGVLLGDEPPQRIEVRERYNDARFAVDVRTGHKTGFYLDQAYNRGVLSTLITDELLAVERPRLLNLFAYTGAFSLHAMSAHPGLTTVNVDASQDSLTLAGENFALNGIDADRYTLVQRDVFDYVREPGSQSGEYDVVIVDPPKFAHNAQQVEKAARGYKDVNLNAFKRVRPGGYLMTYSCSGAVSRDLFQKIVFGALADSGRQAQIVRHLSQSDDHPVALTFPEGEYLKGLLLRVY
jgi:23S rRNA (cytosine1962-C5)-methyltransferase